MSWSTPAGLLSEIRELGLLTVKATSFFAMSCTFYEAVGLCERRLATRGRLPAFRPDPVFSFAGDVMPIPPDIEMDEVRGIAARTIALLTVQTLEPMQEEVEIQKCYKNYNTHFKLIKKQ